MRKTKTQIMILLPVAIFIIAGIFLWQNYHKIVVPLATKSVVIAAPIIIEATPVVTPTSEPKSTHPKPKYEVPILMYHYIRIADPADRLGVALSVTPQNFDQQMTWLKDNNYESMKLVDLADPEEKTVNSILSVQKKPVIITFDDGYADAYSQALPILKKHNFTGTFFIIRDFVGRPEYMTQAQIDKMASYDMEIGSHTLDHKNLAKLPTELAKRQIFDSKIEAETFCYPSGRFTEETVGLVKDAGYKLAVTTLGGISDSNSNLFELPRVRITNVDLESFAKRVQGIR